ncbi:hypothetical protein ACFQ0M_31985 [Kitasatospora aburaviensis]
MTGDDHGIGGTAGRWDGYIAQSPPGCNVADWECVRGSSYIYTDDPLTPAQAKAYTDQGFEVGVHVTTNCRPWGTTAALQGYYRDQLANWRAKYPALPALRAAARTAWSGTTGRPRRRPSWPTGSGWTPTTTSTRPPSPRTGPATSTAPPRSCASPTPTAA